MTGSGKVVVGIGERMGPLGGVLLAVGAGHHIEAVAAAEEGLLDCRRAVDVDVRFGFSHTRCVPAQAVVEADMSDIALEVGAAIDGSEVTPRQVDVGVVCRARTLSATVDGIANDKGAVDFNLGAAPSGGRCSSIHIVVVGVALAAGHIALVAAAIEGVDATPGEDEVGDCGHVGVVIAAEEAADVVDAVLLVVAVGIRVIQWPVDIHLHLCRCHAGLVAAGEEGVDLAAMHLDMDILAIHMVAATEEVADAVGLGSDTSRGDSLLHEA